MNFSGNVKGELSNLHPTPDEDRKIWSLLSTSTTWRDALSPTQFIQECAYMLTVPLASNSGMTLWILVPQGSVPDDRPILASCESFKKRTILRNEEGLVEDGVVHGIASVFCDPKYRGKGYASALMRNLAGSLEQWQISAGEKCFGSILYSDIGKKFYSALGWKEVPNNTHIEFPALSQDIKISGDVQILQATDLAQLCLDDEKMVREDMKTGTARMMIIPDHDHILWHHCKESFATERLFNKIPTAKGALIGEPGHRVWVIWTHRFYHDPKSTPAGNVLYILRLVIEHPERDTEEVQSQLKAVFDVAGKEAGEWGLDVVRVWDPCERVLEMARGLDEWRVVERENEAVASFFPSKVAVGTTGEGVQWVGCEKYAWC